MEENVSGLCCTVDIEEETSYEEERLEMVVKGSETRVEGLEMVAKNIPKIEADIKDEVEVDSRLVAGLAVEDSSDEKGNIMDIGSASDIEKGDSDDCFEDEVVGEQAPDNGQDSSYQLPSVPAEVVLKETNPGEYVYGCSLCEKCYKFKKSAEYHIKVKHKAYSLFCHVCGKTFKIKYDLDRHLNVHKGVRPYPCPECEKSFVCRSSLMRHRKLQHLVGDIYKCHVCDKTFRAETDLKRHLYTHTGERPWPCNLCTKSFVSKSSLKVHEKIHDDSQKFSCATCNKMFHIRADLVRHESVHTGDLRWECSVCQKRYSGKSAVKRHVKDAHIFGKVKYKKEMKVADLVSAITESSSDLKGYSAFVKYNGDKSVDNLLKAVDSFIIYKGSDNNTKTDNLKTDDDFENNIKHAKTENLEKDSDR